MLDVGIICSKALLLGRVLSRRKYPKILERYPIQDPCTLCILAPDFGYLQGNVTFYPWQRESRGYIRPYP